MVLGRGATDSFDARVRAIKGNISREKCEGCQGGKVRARIPYEGAKGSFAVVCAICDHAFDMPRIRQAR